MVLSILDACQQKGHFAQEYLNAKQVPPLRRVVEGNTDIGDEVDEGAK